TVGPETSDLGNSWGIFKRRVCGGAAVRRASGAAAVPCGTRLDGEVQKLSVGEQERRTAGEQQRGGRGDQRRSRREHFGGRRSRHVATGARDIVKLVPQVQKKFHGCAL